MSLGASTPTVSIVIPMFNEAESVAELISGISDACAGLPSFEILAVDDGSTDGTLAALKEAAKTHPSLRILHHSKAGGQSAAVHSGVMKARATVCCTLDGDGQNPPEDLPVLWAPFLNDQSDKNCLVAGQRQERNDTLSKKVASKLANAIRSRVLRDGTADTGCGLKAFPRDAFLALPYFDHMHRYLPALFKAQGWNVILVPVGHRPRKSGSSKYTNLGRAISGAWDLLGVLWLISRAKKTRPEEL